MSADERELLRKIRLIEDYLKKLYYGAIEDAARLATFIRFDNKTFNLDNYPRQKAELNELITRLHSNIESTVINAINTVWQLSNNKNDALANSYFTNKTIALTCSGVLLVK